LYSDTPPDVCPNQDNVFDELAGLWRLLFSPLGVIVGVLRAAVIGKRVRRQLRRRPSPQAVQPAQTCDDAAKGALFRENCLRGITPSEALDPDRPRDPRRPRSPR
jgi:hypothetical protein